MGDEPGLIYHALGGGHGHVLRGLAVLSRLGWGTLVAPQRLRPWAAALGVRCVAPPLAAEQDAQVLRAWMAGLPRPRLVVADVFPRGVVGELEPLRGEVPTWLVARDVRPGYYLDPGVRAAVEACERLVWAEDVRPDLRGLAVGQDQWGPVLLRPLPLDRAAAREELGVPPDARLVMLLASGEPDRQARLARLVVRLADGLGCSSRVISTELPPGPVVRPAFPAARILPAADVVVCAAGYHAVHETAEAGVPTVLVPQGRRYDDQAARARRALARPGVRIAEGPEALHAALRELLTHPRSPLPAPDGAAALVRALRDRLTPPAER